MENIRLPFQTVKGEKYGGILHEARQECRDAGYRALFMDEIMYLRSNTGLDSVVWSSELVSDSSIIMGPMGGRDLVVIAHIPTYCSDPCNMNAAQGFLMGGAMPFPEDEFERLIEMADERKVFVIDNEKLKRSPLTAAGHPLLEAFIGGKDRAMQYIATHQKLFGEDIMMSYFWNFVDWYGDKPYGRLLCVQPKNSQAKLVCDYNMRERGIFLGVPNGCI